MAGTATRQHPPTTRYQRGQRFNQPIRRPHATLIVLALPSLDLADELISHALAVPARVGPRHPGEHKAHNS
jgi:hypothetical protein